MEQKADFKLDKAFQQKLGLYDLNRLNNSKKNIFFFIKNLILFFLSLITYVKIYFFKKRIIGKYFIIKSHTPKLIDTRSLFYIKKNQLNNSINFVRSENFLYSLKAYLKFPNIFFVYSFPNLVNLFNNNLKIINRISYRFYIHLFKKLKILKFDIIDDYKIMPFFIIICNFLSIKITGYMHGRITEDNYVHKKYKFSSFITWSNYFKSKIININNKYKYSDVKTDIKLKFENKKISNRKVKYKIPSILIIQENEIGNQLYKYIIKKLIKIDNIKLLFKFRPKEEPNKLLVNLLKSSNVKFYHTENIEDIIVKNKINIFLGHNSTMLLDAIYYNIFPVILLGKKKQEKNKLNQVNIPFNIDLRSNFEKKLNLILKRTKELNKLKKKIWI